MKKRFSGWGCASIVGLQLAAAACQAVHAIPVLDDDAGADGGSLPDAAAATDAGPTAPDSALDSGKCAFHPVAVDGVDYPGWPIPETPSFEVDPAGTVLDKTTGLRWTKASGLSLTYAEAAAYCASAAPAVGGGWRLPERIELASLLYWRSSGSPQASLASPCYDQTKLDPANVDRGAWSATPLAGTDGSSRWVVDFFQCGQLTADVAERLDARCVSGPKPTPRFEVSESCGVVRDRRAGIEWESDFGDAGTRFESTPELATSCENLRRGEGDGGGWKLPTAQQLASLIQTAMPGGFANRALFPRLVVEGNYAATTSSSVGIRVAMTMSGEPSFNGRFTVIAPGESARGICVRATP